MENFFTYIINTLNNFFFNNLSCNDYFDQFAYNFSFPKTAAMFGIIFLHDYIMYYLLVVLIFTLVFLYLAILSANYFDTAKFKELEYGQRTQLKLFINNYIKEKISLKYSHNVVLEFIWTIVPALILVCIAYPSFTLLYTIDSCVDPIYTVTIIGNQWFWTYEYSDFDIQMYLHNCILDSEEHNLLDHNLNILFNKVLNTKNSYSSFQLTNKLIKIYDLEKKILINSNLVTDGMLPKGYLRLLTTDQALLLPSKTPVRLLITSRDVLHSWAVPCFGIKMDAVPGRLNQVYFYSEFEDISWGQCSELCGVQHGFMPIEVHVVPLDFFLLYIKLKLDSIVKEPFFYLLKIKALTEAKILSDIENNLKSYDTESLNFILSQLKLIKNFKK